MIAGGGADVIVDWLAAALSAREKGVPLVNIAQPYSGSGLLLTCRKDMGVTSTADFKGKTLGVWFFGNEYPFLSWMNKLHYTTSGAHPDVTVLKQGFNVDPLLQKQAACISTITYNEYWQLIEAGMKPEDLIVFKYQDQGVAVLEDGLYTLDKELKDPKKFAALAKFVKASAKGWDYAIKHQAEAVDIILKNDTTGAQTKVHQTSMMKEIARLVEGSKKGTGYLDPADYKRTVGILIANKVLNEKPKGAWTHKVYDAAMK